MFTGLIEHLGRVLTSVRDSEGCTLTIGDAGAVLGDCHIGDSIAVDGACLTVTAFDKEEKGGWFTVWLANETLARTDLGERKAGEEVNLERAMGAGGRFGGHYVQAHVDGTGTVVSREQDGASVRVKIGLGGELLGYVVEKGYVTVDGASLTVTGVDRAQGTLEVMLIEHTQTRITLGKKAVGGRVNIEVDMVAKYVAQSVRAQVDDAVAAALARRGIP